MDCALSFNFLSKSCLFLVDREVAGGGFQSRGYQLMLTELYGGEGSTQAHWPSCCPVLGLSSSALPGGVASWPWVRELRQPGPEEGSLSQAQCGRYLEMYVLGFTRVAVGSQSTGGGSSHGRD